MGITFTKFPLALLYLASMHRGNALEHMHQDPNMVLISIRFEPVNLPLSLPPYLSTRSSHITITISAYTSGKPSIYENNI